jgi:hypothetical protein
MRARRWNAFLSLGMVAFTVGGLAVALLAPGCKFIEGAGDTLATATSGSAVSGVFSGVARAAESMRDYSPAEEHYIGRAVAAEILGKYEVSADKAMQGYVSMVGQAVLAAPERADLKGITSSWSGRPLKRSRRPADWSSSPGHGEAREGRGRLASVLALGLSSR